MSASLLMEMHFFKLAALPEFGLLLAGYIDFLVLVTGAHLEMLIESVKRRLPGQLLLNERSARRLDRSRRLGTLMYRGRG